MKDFADKRLINEEQEATAARRRERAYRVVCNSAAWAVMLMIGALVGYNLALTRPEPPHYTPTVRGSLSPGYCVQYHGCEVCELRGRDNRIIYSTMAC